MSVHFAVNAETSRPAVTVLTSLNRVDSLKRARKLETVKRDPTHLLPCHGVTAFPCFRVTNRRAECRASSSTVGAPFERSEPPKYPVSSYAVRNAVPSLASRDELGQTLNSIGNWGLLPVDLSSANLGTQFGPPTRPGQRLSNLKSGDEVLIREP